MLAAVAVVAAGCGRVGTAAEVDCQSAAGGEVIVAEQSASARGEQLQSERLAVVSQALLRSGVCDRPLVVAVWSAPGSLQLIWPDQDHFEVPGGTERARANRAGPLVDAVMAGTVLPRWEQALVALPSEPSDVLAWPTLARDLLPEDPAGVRVSVLTDGVHVDERLDLNLPLNEATVERLLDGLEPSESLPTDVEVRLLGIGRTADKANPPSGLWNAQLRAFWQAQCEQVTSVCTVSEVVS